ncbi:hypothetical protein [Pseudomonas alabamensis]|uniref:hypothetical protein n=1 Tax=Pseudomonas alabamensis TaxID=3064349 RepID=UPI003F6505A4
MSKLKLNEHKKKCVDSWEEKLSALFKGSIPTRQEWTNPKEIAEVFAAMKGSDAHIFLPGGGGDELKSARATAEGLLEWSGDSDSLDKFAAVVNPKRLTFWSPGMQHHEAHFLLETGALPARCPSGFATDEGTEECVELSKGQYAPRTAWDQGEYNGKDLPETARLVIRATKPARFALFGKGSIYNSTQVGGFDAYNAYHNDAERFEKIVEQFAEIEVE